MTLVGASIVISTLLVGLFVVYKLLQGWANSAYNFYKNDPPSSCDIDSFVSTSDYNSNPPNKLKVSFMHKVQVRGWKGRNARTTPMELECVKSPHVDGLYVSRQAASEGKASGAIDGETVVPIDEVLSTKQPGHEDKPPVIVATIRMGFGHHRIAYSACSWAMEHGHTTIFHDFLNIESDEADMIRTLDHFYSKFSRVASEFGSYAEKAWGQMMKQGDADALRAAALTGAQLQCLLTKFPKDTPIVCTHQVCALTAAAAGFTNVVNLVVDNFPQWFLVVPKTLNITQGPVNYQSYLKMGVPPADLRLAGHWCPSDLVKNIEADCNRRIARAKDPSNKPRRLLIPVGGAGAQKSFIINFIEAVEPWIRDGKLQLFLNAGDHKHMKTAFVEVLGKCKLDYDTVTTTQGVRDFQSKLLGDGSPEPAKAVTLFAFEDYFPAVATTDLLCRVADVLTCKPSELAFYPIPKLHIRRVGDHEAYSAIRAAEVNDGSLEAREISDALRYLELLCNSTSEGCDLLPSWNQAIIDNHVKLNMYDGCKNAVKWAGE
mmetsp:Transcript_27370/g.58551  ORF Transcript_27370/g.58551 Transcript_27370/m.58551 type:complete len:545 (-) Transcript_27370:565-2199(-)|eukprot:CAMPEP_0201124800 /NCGR_PEP_ID=MMETSP0850-20130426/17408_1 /ASSEMBLY_ACC=CAM_ASM_000622 /TAXON_ID=183588 /ORGANISM="Pseudo-nitzschia fraudulenta, Strain WWA7" /LENGTH=544 /DNA_ID=CAMNT_0047392437 /DNA_START=105 /DNA_END=1739 /DNA_ORIENTATION=-